MHRRDFVRMLAAGAVLPLDADARAPEEPYDRAIVIDALAVERAWDAEGIAAIRRSGYTGIQTTLPSNTLDASLRALREWSERFRAQPEVFLQVTRAADFERAKREGRLAVMPGFQNAAMIGEDLDNLDALYRLGARCIQLTYNTRNLLGDGCTERTNAGLSDFGVAAVERMNELGILVDLSHCGEATSMDGIRFSRRPPAFTHTFCKAIHDHPRAKSDALMRALADRGGVIGMTALGYFVGPTADADLDDYLDHIDHAVRVAGIDHVGLASDFEIRGIQPWATRENWYEPRLRGFKPSYNVRWPPWIPELDVPERFRNVARGLERRGYRGGDVEKILGLNWLRHFREILG